MAAESNLKETETNESRYAQYDHLIETDSSPEVVAVMNKLYRIDLQGEKPEKLYITTSEADKIREENKFFRATRPSGTRDVDTSEFLKLTSLANDTRAATAAHQKAQQEGPTLKQKIEEELANKPAGQSLADWEDQFQKNNPRSRGI